MVAMIDCVLKFIGYFDIHKFYINQRVKQFNWFIRKVRWFIRLREFELIYMDYVEKQLYIEPFERLLEWDIFFRDTGPYIEPGYLNAYRFKLLTVREEPFMHLINVIKINDWLLEDQSNIELDVGENRDKF